MLLSFQSFREGKYCSRIFRSRIFKYDDLWIRKKKYFTYFERITTIIHSVFPPPRSIKSNEETKPTLINSKLPPIAAAHAFPTFPTINPVNLNNVWNLLKGNWSSKPDIRTFAVLILINLTHWSLDHNSLENFQEIKSKY